MFNIDEELEKLSKNIGLLNKTMELVIQEKLKTPDEMHKYLKENGFVFMNEIQSLQLAEQLTAWQSELNEKARSINATI